MFLKCGEKNNTNYTFGKTDKKIKKADNKPQKPFNFCTACGNKLSASAIYCSKCGSPV